MISFSLQWAELFLEIIKLCVVVGIVILCQRYLARFLAARSGLMTGLVITITMSLCLIWPIDIIQPLLGGDISILGSIITGLFIFGTVTMRRRRGGMNPSEIQSQHEPLQTSTSGQVGSQEAAMPPNNEARGKAFHTIHFETDHVKQAKIGEAGQNVRALNFAGGGYDTVMQLGVTHAFLVAQAKAPDVVVGVSAGAFQAAAMAEILQAGPELADDDKLITEQDYKTKLAARVARFRQFLEANLRSPERLLDAALPDAYEIDAHDPLQPLQTPFFSAEERKERVEAIKRKSGLVRLYNDLLEIDLPFGTVVRGIRRYLGFKAADDINRKWHRRWVKTIELLRGWLLLGMVLPRLVPVVPMLVKPLRGKKSAIHPSTAGSLIFRFKTLERIAKGFRVLWSFLLILSLWLGVTWVVAIGFPWVIAWCAAGFFSWPLGFSVVAAIGFFHLTIIILSLSKDVIEFDSIYAEPIRKRTDSQLSESLWRKRWRSLQDTLKTTFMLFYLLFKWSAVLALLLIALILGFYIVSGFLATSITWLQPIRPDTSAGVIMTVTGVALIMFAYTIVRVFWRIISTILSFISGKKKNAISFGTWYMRRFLQGYDINESLFHPYGLKQFLIELFDPDYYGGIDFDTVLDDSLQNRTHSSIRTNTKYRCVGDYSTKETCRPRIHVGVALANIGTRDLDIAKSDCSLIDALVAATAVPGLFPPKVLDGNLYVDAVNIANVPTRGLLKLLRKYIHEQAEEVYIYSVSPIPISRKSLNPDPESNPEKKKSYLNLIDIAIRALQLQRFKDATFEKELTELFTRMLPENKPVLQVDDEKYFRAKVFPIELQQPVSLNKRIIFAPKERRREAMAETIADGCRAAMEAMILPSITFTEKQPKEEQIYISCRDVIKKYRESNKIQCDLPGSNQDPSPPGLPEICNKCSVCDIEGQTLKQTLVYRPELVNDKKFPHWPNELAVNVPTAHLKMTQPNIINTEETTASSTEPTINLLFSGGVFRGVFQMGVINALNLLEVKPHIIGGASIGSITAAMVASTFELESKEKDKIITFQLRQAQIMRLASTYLSVDRMILTDRFSDFVRNLTIRAAETEFSLKEADHVFRKYDHPKGKRFEKSLRRVVAGIERLFYINPYQLNKAIFSIRNRHIKGIGNQFTGFVQNWLDRMNVGDEVLGAEPLNQLIQEYVIPEENKSRSHETPFGVFDTTFIATTTDLTEGKLETLKGSSSNNNTDAVSAMLTEGLLSSSAFPGVFRPRWSWELFPGTNQIHQYIDGGVMDNLPIDAVVKQLVGEVNAKQILARPQITSSATLSDNGNSALLARPHLIFAASLETAPKKLKNQNEWKHLAESWPELRKRAKQLKYNIKMNTYEHAEKNISKIYNKLQGEISANDVLDLEIITVKPRWLCNTFAFHPMLGFRRENQAKSIAHGCASTLLSFANTKKDYLDSWKLNAKNVPQVKNWDEANELLRSKKQPDDGRCWLNNNLTCPFSTAGLSSISETYYKETTNNIGSKTRHELNKIYQCCKDQDTHKLN